MTTRWLNNNNTRDYIYIYIYNIPILLLLFLLFFERFYPFGKSSTRFPPFFFSSSSAIHPVIKEKKRDNKTRAIWSFEARVISDVYRQHTARLVKWNFPTHHINKVADIYPTPNQPTTKLSYEKSDKKKRKKKRNTKILDTRRTENVLIFRIIYIFFLFKKKLVVTASFYHM